MKIFQKYPQIYSVLIPAISVPIGLSKNDLPLGFQIIGKRFDEDSVLSAAKIIETNANFKKESD